MMGVFGRKDSYGPTGLLFLVPVKAIRLIQMQGDRDSRRAQ